MGAASEPIGAPRPATRRYALAGRVRRARADYGDGDSPRRPPTVGSGVRTAPRPGDEDLGCKSSFYTNAVQPGRQANRHAGGTRRPTLGYLDRSAAGRTDPDCGSVGAALL